jgi:hypothetical protein
MYELDKAKTLYNLDEALKLSQELDASKKELEVVHANLSKDFEHLEKNHSLLKGKLTTLRTTYDQLHASHMKTLGTPISPIIVDLNAYASNILCDQASLLEENKKLKAQLEKGLISCIQGEKNLNEVLSNQKVNSSRGGLGFNSNNNKIAPPPQKINFVQEGHKGNVSKNANVTNVIASKSIPTHNNFAGKYNPSYALCKYDDGYVYARYVGPCNEYAFREYAIWVPKTLVTNVKGPIVKWVPKF